MEVTYLGHYGDDLTCVNAARVSFGKRKEVFDARDERLIKYLVKHGHVLPFRHPHVPFHFKAPIFVARQLVKHQVGMSWSEISRRYVTGNLEFYWPDVWRKAASDKKQGSLTEAWEDPLYAHLRNPNVAAPAIKRGGNLHWTEHALAQAQDAVALYEAAVADGLAPEQARMILPQNMYTEWHWTGSLLAWAHVWRLRAAADAQAETRECVLQIGPKMQELFPVSWPALTGVVAVDG